MKIHIRFEEPMATRPCKYCLAFQDDTVFADFDLNKDNCVFLVRISFDGYGLCHPNPKVGITPMNREESDLFINRIESLDLNHLDLSEMLRSYFFKNRDALWNDALEENGLI